MKQCKQCIFYDKEYDILRQSGDDIIIEGQDEVEKHFCRQCDKAIDNEIILDNKICERCISK